MKRTGNAADQGGLARSVGADQTQTLAATHLQVDFMQGCESAKVLGDFAYFEDCFHFFTSPSTPSGANTTNKTNNTPTTSTFNSLEMVTVTTC